MSNETPLIRNIAVLAAPGFTLPVGSTCTGLVYNGFANSRDMFAPPRDYKQDKFTLSGDYELGAGSLEASLERENFSHTYRERNKTWEDKIKLGYVNTSFDQATLRASYETDRKRGSFYDPFAIGRGGANWFTIYGGVYSRAGVLDLIANKSGTGGIYPTLANIQAGLLLTGNYNTGNGFYKPDQADRNQEIINARLNYIARDDLDIGANLQLKRANYPTNSRGVQKDDLNTYSIDVNYQPSAGMQISTYYTRQEGKQRQVENYAPAGTAGQARVTPKCGAIQTVNNLDCYLNNSLDPAADVLVDNSNTNDTLGISYQQDIGLMKLGIDYSHTYGKSYIGQVYGPTVLTAAQLTTVATLGGFRTWPLSRTR